MSRAPRFVLAAVLSLTSSIALASIHLGPEVPLPQPGVGTAAGRQRPGAVATDGTDFMNFWTDESSGRVGLYATRVTADGAVQQKALPIRRSGAYVRDVSACWNGSKYLVAWTDDASRGAMTATVSADATSATEPRPIPGTRRTMSGGLACTGSRALMATFSMNTSNQTVLSGVTLDADGQVLATTEITRDLQSDAVRVASSGSRFGVFWFGTAPLPPGVAASVVMARVTMSGDLVNPAPVTVAAVPVAGPFGAAGGNGTFGLVVASSTVAGGRMRRFRIDDATAAVTELPSAALPKWPFDMQSLVWNGADFVLFPLSYDTNFFQITVNRFASTDVGPVVSGTSLAVDPRAACNSARCEVAWMSGPISQGAGDVSALLTSADGKSLITPPMVIDRSTIPQLAPHIAASTTGSLAVWLEQKSDSSVDLLAMRLTAAGVPREAPHTLVTNIGPYPPLGVAAVGSGFVVVWSRTDDGSGMFSVGIGNDGTVGTATRIADAGWAFGLASNGSIALVSLISSKGLAVIRLDASGKPLDAAPAVVSPAAGYRPLAASNGTDFLVVWNEGSDFWQFPTPDAIDVRSARVFASGAVDAAPIAVATGPKDQIARAVASDGRDYLILVDVINTGLTAKRILREGALADGSATDDGKLIAPVDAYDTSAVRLGDGYLLAWRTFDNPGIHLVRTNSSADAVLDESVQQIAVDGWLSMTSLGGAAQLAYSRLDDSPGSDGSQRIFVRVVTSGPQRIRAARR